MSPALEHDHSAELIALAKDADEKAQRLMGHALGNVQRDPVKRIAQDIAYERATRDWEAAHCAYRNAINAAANEPTASPNLGETK